jgi:hypothetical protein
MFLHLKTLELFHPRVSINIKTSTTQKCQLVESLLTLHNQTNFGQHIITSLHLEKRPKNPIKNPMVGIIA